MLAFEHSLHKYILHQQHIAYSACCYRQQQIAQGCLQDNCQHYGYGFRQAVAAAKNLRILEGLDNKHAHNGRRQHFT